MKVTVKILTMTAIVFLATLLLPAWETANVTFNGVSVFKNAAQAQIYEPYPINIYKTYPETMEEAIPDPIEPYNRAVFKFNDRLYFWVLKPVGEGYAKVVPEVARIGLRNAFYNFLFPVRFVNNVLQLKPTRAGAEAARFLLNSTFGFAGFYNFVDKQCTAKLGPYEEDFGQTLGHYKMKPAFYIVWPLLGPSSFRDSIGLVGDAFTDPTFYLPIPWYAVGGIKVVQQVNDVSLRLGDYEDFLQAALDPYVAMRNGYTQYRENQVRQ